MTDQPNTPHPAPIPATEAAPHFAMPPEGFLRGQDLNNDGRLDAAQVTFQDGRSVVGRHYRMPTSNPGVTLETVVAGVHVEPQETDPARIIAELNATWQQKYDRLLEHGRRRIEAVEGDRKVAAQAALDARQEEKAAKKKAKEAEEKTLAMQAKFWVSLAGGILILMFYVKVLFIDPPRTVTDTVTVSKVDQAAIDAAIADAKVAWKAKASSYLESIRPLLDDPILSEDDYSRGRAALELDE